MIGWNQSRDLGFAVPRFPRWRRNVKSKVFINDSIRSQQRMSGAKNSCYGIEKRLKRRGCSR